jgi:Cu(I)/Ag(I) efflux system membrane protein CusA/SilA
MPIRNRIEMQNTGIRTAVGVKVTGTDVDKIEDLGKQVEVALRRIRGTRSAFAERVNQGYFLDFDLKRDALALRHERGRRAVGHRECERRRRCHRRDPRF